MKCGDMMNNNKINELTIPNCPYCGTKLLKVVYGMPAQETLEKAEKGEIILGGCIIEENQPKYFCNNCKKDFSSDLKECIDKENNWDEIRYNKISKSDFLKLNEKNLIFITNPGRMGDEDGTTFIIKNGNELTVYRIDGWMYKEENKEDVSLKDMSKQFPIWYKTWKNNNKKDYGKYQYLYMGFGNGLSIDNSIYKEFEPYLNQLLNDYFKNYSNEEKESYKFAAIFNVWEDAFIKMVNDKGYILK